MYGVLGKSLMDGWMGVPAGVEHGDGGCRREWEGRGRMGRRGGVVRGGRRGRWGVQGGER